MSEKASKAESSPTPIYAIVRIRGAVDAPKEVEYTLRLLRLIRKFHCTLYPATPPIEGMLRKVKDWVTWGEVTTDVIALLLRERGRVRGGYPLTDEYVKRTLGLSGIEELAKKIATLEMPLHKLEDYGIKPVFRLHPPKGGFKGSIKRPYKDGGELGYRGSNIVELLMRMI